jgi:transposase
MPKTRELTEFERGEIIGLWKGDHSERDIVNILEFSKTTIHDTIERYKKENQILSAPRSGRPPKLSERNIRELVKIVKEDRQQSLNEIAEKFNDLSIVSVSSYTVQRTLHNEGFFGRAGKRKPLVSEVNRKKRLEWCKTRKNWDLEWNNIIWSDESRFLLFQNDSHHWVWRCPHEKYDVNCLIPTIKSGNNGIMVWGCFNKSKIGPLIQVSGRITGSVYIEVLENHLLPFINELDNNEEYIFQDDNAPVHRAKIVKQWMENNSITNIPWPAQSPDLNPIEHLWDVLERKVRKHAPHPKNLTELMAVLEEEWYKIEPEVLENLVDSMPRRVQAVIDSHGNPTKY